MSKQTMDRAAAGRFVEAWCANWCKVDIDAVVAHFAENAEMRSPLGDQTDGVACGRGRLRTFAPTGARLTEPSRARI